MGVREILFWQGPTLGHTMCKVFECPRIAMARPKLERLKCSGWVTKTPILGVNGHRFFLVCVSF